MKTEIGRSAIHVVSQWRTLPLAFALVLFACKENPVVPPNNGPVWVAYRSSAVSSLRSDRINALALGFDGTMWIGTDSGATWFHKSVWGDIHDSLRYLIFSQTGSYYSYKVNALASGYDGSLWIGTAGGGVKRFRSGASTDGWRTYVQPVITYNTISAIATDPYYFGEVWVATPLVGLSRFIPNTLVDPLGGAWTTITGVEAPELGSNQIRSAGYDLNDGSYWFGSQVAVSKYLEGEGWKQLLLPAASHGTVYAIAFDYSNTVWLGQNDGVTTFREPNYYQHFTNATTAGKFPRAGVNAIVTNNYSLRWFGTEAGLVQLNDTAWTTFSSATVPEFTSDNVTALAYDRKGNLWIGTSDGLLVHNPVGIVY